jgi:hypothetical protein
MHKCHADGCTTIVPTQMLMCRRHWRIVPPQTQRSVYEGWAVQRQTSEPVAEYVQARTAAIKAVKRKEGGDRHD